MNIEKELYQAIRRKFNTINHRCKTRAAYLRKNITNDFSWDEFLNFAITAGFFIGCHTHRRDNTKSYCASNVEFLTPAEHASITGRERRKLTPNTVNIMRDMYRNGISTRQLTKQFDCSQTLAWSVVTYNSYKDIVPVLSPSFN